MGWAADQIDAFRQHRRDKIAARKAKRAAIQQAKDDEEARRKRAKAHFEALRKAQEQQ